MNTDKTEFQGKHSGVTSVVLKAYYDVYRELGSGFLESVYHSAIEAALVDAGLSLASQVEIPVYFRGKKISGFKADLVVEGLVLVELKAVHALDRTHHAQVLNYLKATALEVALLLNFGGKPEFKRFVLDNEEKKIRVVPRESVVSF
jgi:GxxExxY protein